MRRLGVLRPVRRRDEKGAMAVLVAIFAIVMFGCAALAVDVASLSMERQKLHDHVDAAAHAGAMELPASGTKAKTWATTMAKSQDAAMNPAVDLFCVVRSTGASKQIAPGQIPATCDPGTYSSSTVRCNTSICSIPCPATASCNTVRVSDTKMVPYKFAPVIGQNQGSTGSVTSAACKGSCGQEAPNPMDIVFMADRTTSMSDTDRGLMKQAILDSLKTMSPALHYVAFGALHKSVTSGGSCSTAPSGYDSKLSDAANVKAGTWIPVPFSNNYLTSSTTPTLNTGSALVAGVSCLPNSAVPGWKYGSYGTHLASGLKAAVRYVTGKQANNLSSLPARVGTAQKVVVFETDGMPDEILDEGSTSLDTSGDLGAGLQSDDANNGQQGCDNLLDVADKAKDAGVVVITIGFGDANTARCRKGSTNSAYSRVRDVLAASASSNPLTGAASDASDCSTTSGRTDENSDGDYFFCAASGSELKDIFKTAVSLASSSVRLITLP